MHASHPHAFVSLFLLFSVRFLLSTYPRCSPALPLSVADFLVLHSAASLIVHVRLDACEMELRARR